MKELKRCPFCGKKPVWHVVGEANDLLKFGCPDGCVEWIQAFTKPYYENALQTLEIRWNRRAGPENKPLTLEQLKKMDGERVWTQFRGLGMYGLVAYHSDPDGDDGDNVYITNNLGGRDTFEKTLDQGGTVYARKPEGSEKP